MRLILTSKPRHDESLMGYVLRLTELNGYHNPSIILALLGLERSALQSCQFVFGKGWDLSALSQLTGVREAELVSMRYDSPSDNSVHSRYMAFGSPLYSHFIRPRNPKVCPACLRDYGYCRQIWELSPITSCLFRKCLLIDCCAHCEKNITWVRKSLSFCNCRHDWRKSDITLVGDSELG